MNSERVKNWAHIAEIVSSVAVVFTLVFLIFEIRANSDLIRANTFDRSIESLIELRMNIASNDGSLKVMADHWGVESPDELRRQLLVNSLWSIYEKTYYAQQYDFIGQAEWERFETRICGYVQTRREFWNEKIADFLSEEFREFVIITCTPAANE